MAHITTYQFGQFKLAIADEQTTVFFNDGLIGFFISRVDFFACNGIIKFYRKHSQTRSDHIVVDLVFGNGLVRFFVGRRHLGFKEQQGLGFVGAHVLVVFDKMLVFHHYRVGIRSCHGIENIIAGQGGNKARECHGEGRQAQASHFKGPRQGQKARSNQVIKRKASAYKR
eukprot:scaffold8649_cov185-Amphora_coffeaeformis.AAC.15